MVRGLTSSSVAVVLRDDIKEVLDSLEGIFVTCLLILSREAVHLCTAGWNMCAVAAVCSLAAINKWLAAVHKETMPHVPVNASACRPTAHHDTQLTCHRCIYAL